MTIHRHAMKFYPKGAMIPTVVYVTADTSRTYSEVWVDDPMSSSKGHVQRYQNPKDALKAMQGQVEILRSQGWQSK